VCVKARGVVSSKESMSNRLSHRDLIGRDASACEVTSWLVGDV
jgi:hypothetical protein